MIEHPPTPTHTSAHYWFGCCVGTWMAQATMAPPAQTQRHVKKQAGHGLSYRTLFTLRIYFTQYPEPKPRHGLSYRIRVHPWPEKWMCCPLGHHKRNIRYGGSSMRQDGGTQDALTKHDMTRLWPLLAHSRLLTKVWEKGPGQPTGHSSTHTR